MISNYIKVLPEFLKKDCDGCINLLRIKIPLPEIDIVTTD